MNIEKLIDKEIKENRDKHIAERGDKKQTSFYASSLGSCLRGQYFSRLGVKRDKDFDNRTLRVFHCGNMFEDWVMGLITKGAKKVETQVYVSDKKLNVSGSIDAIVDGMPIEIKSKNSRAFWYMKKDGKAMEQHKKQLWIYLYLLKAEKGKIVYISKDDMTTAQYTVFLNDKLLAKSVLEELKLLNKSWKNKNPAVLWLPDEKSWQAKYCGFHSSHCLKV